MPMKNSIVDRFMSASLGRRARFLARVSYLLTVSARETYVVNCPEVENQRKLRVINEMQHRVTSHLGAILETGDFPHPVDSWFEFIRAIADEGQLHEVFESILEEASPALYPQIARRVSCPANSNPSHIACKLR